MPGRAVRPRRRRVRASRNDVRSDQGEGGDPACREKRKRHQMVSAMCSCSALYTRRRGGMFVVARRRPRVHVCIPTSWPPPTAHRLTPLLAIMSAPSAGGVPRPGLAKPVFDPKTLDRTVIALPLLQQFSERGEDAVFDVVIDLTLSFPGGREHARERVRDLAAAALASAGGPQPGVAVDERKSALSDQYVFARLTGRAIKAMVRLGADFGEGGRGGGVAPVRAL